MFSLKTLLFTIIISVVYAQIVIFNDGHRFNLWKSHYNKGYMYAREHDEHFLNWVSNKYFVFNHNMNKSKTFQIEMNAFADQNLTKIPGKNVVLSYSIFKKPQIFYELENDLPLVVDWREKGVVTEVKNQGECGSCWTFSATGSIEGQLAKQTGILNSYSEAQIVDCDTYGSGCSGGLMDNAFRYVIENGIELEVAYPYIPKDEKCSYEKKKATGHISSFQDIEGGERGLQEAVATIGPISVAIDASQPDFRLYSKGVYYNEECSETQLDHGVLVVGYGSENGKDYWIVKNSWGKDWGDDGYILMARNKNNNCGISTKASYPIV